MYRYPQHNDILVAPEHAITFAWSAPLRDLAPKIGISDVGLKKLLLARGVAPPPQGYWNKVAAGAHTPRLPAPPPRRAGETGRIRFDMRFRGLIPEAPPLPVDGPFASKEVPEDLEELRAIELKALGRVLAPRNLDLAHPGMSQMLKREQRQREKFAVSGYSWHEPAFTSPFDQRRLRVLNGVLLALAKRGHSGDAHEHEGALNTRAFIGDTIVYFAITASNEAKNKKPARNGRWPIVRGEAPPLSTPIAIVIGATWQADAPVEIWQDQDDQKLEAQLASVAAAIIVAGEARFRVGLREALKRQEEHRQYLREERQRRLAALNSKRFEDLKTSGELLRAAEDIRALMHRVKQAVLAGEQHVSPDELASWEAWAAAYADRTDPIKSGQVLTHLRAPALSPEDEGD
jgi:hypothetical protein